MHVLSLYSGIGGLRKQKRVDGTCEVCGSPFVSWNPNPRFCSRACFGKSQRAAIDIQEAIRLYESGMSQVEVAQALGTTQKVLHGAFKRAGYTCRPKIKRDQRGAKNATWKGGVTYNAAGYRLVLAPDHPRAQLGYVFEHVLVVEAALNRFLEWHGPGHPDTEIVHHINGCKTDNRLENLQVVTYAEHLRIHAQGEERRSAQ